MKEKEEVQETITLLKSMIQGSEQHTALSELKVQKGLSALEELDEKEKALSEELDKKEKALSALQLRYVRCPSEGDYVEVCTSLKCHQNQVEHYEKEQRFMRLMVFIILAGWAASIVPLYIQ